MIRLIDRSITREVTGYLILTAVISTVILFASQAADFAELVVKRNVSPTLIRTLFLSLLPRVVVITLPLSLLVGVMTGLGRMGADHEITATSAAGISPLRLVVPLVVLGLVISLIVFALTAYVIPRSYRRFHEIRAELLLQGLRTTVKPRVFDDRFVDKVLYIEDIDRRTDRWNRIFLAMTDDRAPSPVVITARTGMLELGDTPETSLLVLENGFIHRRTEGDQRYEVEAFDRLLLRFDAHSRQGRDGERASPSPRQRIQQMTLGELMQASDDPEFRRRLRIELHKRLAFCFAPLIFALLGSAVSVRPQRMSRGLGLTLSLLLSCIYYLVLLAGENFARAGAVRPFIGLWAANALFLMLAFLISRRDPSWLKARTKQRLWNVVEHGVRALKTLRRRLVRATAVEWIRTERPQPDRRAFPHILDRYIVKTFLSALLPVLVGLWMLLLVFTLFELASDIINNRISAHRVAEYCLYLTPVIVVYTLGPSLLLGAMICFSLLGRTSELVAMKASGLSVYRLALPVLGMCAVFSLAILWGQDSIIPAAHARQDALRFYIKRGRFPQELELAPATPSWVMAGPESSIASKTYRVYHYTRYDRWKQRLDRPLVVELSASDFAPRDRLEAQWAQWDPASSKWVFAHATHWRFRSSHILSQHESPLLVVALPEGPDYFTKEPLKPDHMTTSQLMRYIRHLSQTGVDTTELEVALHRKNALALTCLVMGFFGIPFGIAFGRQGALSALALGAGLGLASWLMQDIFSQLGKYGYFSPVIAAWAPCGLLGAGGLYALFRCRT
jgi:LPS export ABC transporter permease LptF/LPS export ABC transporter permease LptG